MYAALAAAPAPAPSSVDTGGSGGGEVTAMIQGIAVPLHAPLARVWRVLHAPDLWLYVYVSG